MNGAAITTEQAQAIIDAFIQAMQIVAEAVRQFVEAVKSAMAKIAEKFRAWLHAFLRGTNPKLYHLAFHAKTRRARKKNLRRLLQQLSTQLAQGPVP